MSDGTEVVEVESQDDAAALASAMAGYSARGATPPADAPQEPSEQVEVTTQEPEPVIVETTAEPDLEVKSLADQLAELKAQVKNIASTNDSTAVRRLHSDVGEINRSIKQLQSQVPTTPPPAPVNDALTAAMEAAEASAEEFPELMKPVMTALKAVHANQATPAPAPVIDVAAEVAKARQKDAIEALAEEHPDYETVRDTPEFKAWELTKTPDYLNRFHTTWNPAVVAKGLSEFKESLRTKQKKQERLAAAVVAPSTQQKSGPSTLPDEQGYHVGYNKGARRLNR